MLNERGQPAERILVVPFADGIGDFVMMLPLLGVIRKHYHDAAITVAASARSTALLDETQAAAFEIRTPSWLQSTPQPRGGLLRRLVPQTTVAVMSGFALHMELGRFDRTLNLFRWWEHGIDFARYWTPHVPARPGAVHTLDCLADRLSDEIGVSISREERLPRARVRRAAAAWADDWWAGAVADGRPVVALVPASNMRIKRWPVASWLRLSQELAGAGYLPLFLLPPADDPVGTALQDAGQPAWWVRASLDRMAALLARCRLAVGVDTGLLHLAAAVGTRYVGLFGPTNPQVTGPYDRSLGTALIAPVHKTAACRGCWRQFKYIDDRCRALPAGSCMSALDVETVLAACLDELSRTHDTPCAVHP